MAPFPAAAHRTGRADLPHPALGRASREGIRGSSGLAQPVEIQHSHLPVHFAEAEAAGSAGQFVTPTQKPYASGRLGEPP